MNYELQPSIIITCQQIDAALVIINDTFKEI